MHLDDPAIHRLLIGDSTPESAVAREHLASCGECRTRLAAAEREDREIAGLLQKLDQPVPAISLPDLRAQAERRVPGNETRLARRTHSRHTWWRRAAAIVIALGLLRGAYAMPGSPLPKWIDAVVERVAKPAPTVPAPNPPAAAERSPAPAPASATGMSGIAVVPGPSLLIAFQQPAGEGEIQVSLVDATEVAVRAPIGAATFTSGTSRILVDQPISAAVFEVAIPRSAPRVEIQVDGRRIFLKEGSAITTATPAGAGASYVLPLVSAP